MYEHMQNNNKIGSCSYHKKRIGYADLTKVTAIYLVLWGHVIPQLIDQPSNENRIYIFIYAFHMPLFMMVSGFFANSSMSLKFKDLLIKKFRQLILPALSFGVLWYLHDIITGYRDLSVYSFLYLEAECFWVSKISIFCISHRLVCESVYPLQGNCRHSLMSIFHGFTIL